MIASPSSPPSSSGRRQHKRGPLNRWSENEDLQLVCAIQVHGTSNWSIIRNAVGSSKTVASCYQRWNRVINPALSKGPFSIEEYRRLALGVIVEGEQWAKVAELLPGRTDTQCRARWMQVKRQKHPLYRFLTRMVLGWKSSAERDANAALLRNPEWARRHFPELPVAAMMLHVQSQRALQSSAPADVACMACSTEGTSSSVAANCSWLCLENRPRASSSLVSSYFSDSDHTADNGQSIHGCPMQVPRGAACTRTSTSSTYAAKGCSGAVNPDEQQQLSSDESVHDATPDAAVAVAVATAALAEVDVDVDVDVSALSCADTDYSTTVTIGNLISQCASRTHCSETARSDTSFEDEYAFEDPFTSSSCI
eukprot:ANDGO_07659.mRNA.1 Myb-related protein MYBAS2